MDMAAELIGVRIAPMMECSFELVWSDGFQYLSLLEWEIEVRFWASSRALRPVNLFHISHFSVSLSCSFWFHFGCRSRLCSFPPSLLASLRFPPPPSSSILLHPSPSVSSGFQVSIAIYRQLRAASGGKQKMRTVLKRARSALSDSLDLKLNSAKKLRGWDRHQVKPLIFSFR